MEDLESRQLVLQLRLVSAAIRALPSQEALQQVLEEERQAHRRLKAEHNLLLAFLRSSHADILQDFLSTQADPTAQMQQPPPALMSTFSGIGLAPGVGVYPDHLAEPVQQHTRAHSSKQETWMPTQQQQQRRATWEPQPTRTNASLSHQQPLGSLPDKDHVWSEPGIASWSAAAESPAGGINKLYRKQQQQQQQLGQDGLNPSKHPLFDIQPISPLLSPPLLPDDWPATGSSGASFSSGISTSFPHSNPAWQPSSRTASRLGFSTSAFNAAAGVGRAGSHHQYDTADRVELGVGSGVQEPHVYDCNGSDDDGSDDNHQAEGVRDSSRRSALFDSPASPAYPAGHSVTSQQQGHTGQGRQGLMTASSTGSDWAAADDAGAGDAAAGAASQQHSHLPGSASIPVHLPVQPPQHTRPATTLHTAPSPLPVAAAATTSTTSLHAFFRDPPGKRQPPVQPPAQQHQQQLPSRHHSQPPLQQQQHPWYQSQQPWHPSQPHPQPSYLWQQDGVSQPALAQQQPLWQHRPLHQEPVEHRQQQGRQHEAQVQHRYQQQKQHFHQQQHKAVQDQEPEYTGGDEDCVGSAPGHQGATWVQPDVVSLRQAWRDAHTGSKAHTSRMGSALETQVHAPGWQHQSENGSQAGFVHSQSRSGRHAPGLQGQGSQGSAGSVSDGWETASDVEGDNDVEERGGERQATSASAPAPPSAIPTAGRASDSQSGAGGSQPPGVLASQGSSLPAQQTSHFPGPAGAQCQVLSPPTAPAPAPGGAGYGQQHAQHTQARAGAGSVPTAGGSPSSGSEADSRLLHSLRELGTFGAALGRPPPSSMSSQGWPEAAVRPAAEVPHQIGKGPSASMPGQHTSQLACGDGMDHNYSRRARYGGDSSQPADWRHSSQGESARPAAAGRRVHMQAHGQQEGHNDSAPLSDQQYTPLVSAASSFNSALTRQFGGSAIKQHIRRVPSPAAASAAPPEAAVGGSSAHGRVPLPFPADASPTDQAADIHHTSYTDRATTEQGIGSDHPAGRHAPPGVHARKVHGRAAVMSQATPASLGSSPLTGAGLAASDQLFAALKARLASLQATLGQE